jgi:RHS repeat-associated protein
VTLIPDIQGSVIGSLDSATATLAKTAYLPFGESANTSGSYRYTGRRIDAETNGLYYYRARTYSPVLGRFIQPDPIGYAGGANLYAYVGNDPLNLVDPSGLFMERTAYNASVAWQVMKDNPGDVALGAGLVVGGIALGALSTGATPFTGGLSLGGNFAAGGAISGGTVLIGAAITAAEVTVAGTAIASGIIMMNQAANGGGGDVTRRPSSFRKGTVNESWNNAPDGPNGGKLCPTCGAEVHGQPGVAPRRGNWDIDHNPKWGERNLEGLDRKGVLDNYNSDTRLRCVPCNRADN